MICRQDIFYDYKKQNIKEQVKEERDANIRTCPIMLPSF